METKNPYLPPQSGLTRGDFGPSWNRPRSQVVAPIVALFLGGLAGGVSGRRVAISQDWSYGGVPVSLSQFGEVFFFGVGAIAGLGATVLLAVLLAIAGSRLPGWVRWGTAVFLSPIVGIVVAPIALRVLSLVFFTIPDELFHLLTD